MKNNELRVPDYLAHILQAIERINTYTSDMDELGFLENLLVQDAVIRNIEIVGEAARNIEKHYPDFTSVHNDVPWEDMYWMRNRVSHGYFSVDLEVIWNTIQRDIPELEQQIKSVLKQYVSQLDPTIKP